MISDLFITSIGLGRDLPEESYLNTLAVVRSLKQMEYLPITKRVTFLVGENGTGKSTLMEAVAVHQGFNPEGGTLNFRFSTMDSNWLYFYDNEKPDGILGGEKGFTRIECVGRYPAPGGLFPSPKASSGWLRGHVESLYHFLSSVYSVHQEAPTFEDAAYVQNIMSAAYRSAEFGCWQNVEGDL